MTSASGNNAGDGRINLTIAGGTTPYQYLWPDGSTQNSLENLNPGEYCVTITDALCCFYEKCMVVEVCEAALSIAGEIEHMCINGPPTGSIDVTVMGGGGPLSYLWNTGATTQDINNIETPGTYYVSVTDACDNSEIQVFDVGIFFNYPPDYFVYSPSSCQTNDGNIDVTIHGSHPEGGIPPYTYQWSTGQETPGIGGLGAGTYILTVTDAEGCAGTFAFNLVPEGSPHIELSDIIMPSCEGEDNGAIEILVYTENIQDYSSMYPAYEILWYNSSGQLIYTDPNNNYDSDATGLPPGAYTVTVKDISGSPFSGCTSSATFIVEERPSLGPFMAPPQITPTCYGDNTGRIFLNTSGGNPPYTYSWDNGQYTQSIHYLSFPSSYSVTVTDNCGRKIIHNGLSVPSYTAISNTIVSEGGCPGSIELETSGGGAPYTYLWSNGQTGVTATGLINGSGYQVTVSDANGCTMAQTFFVPIDEEDAFDLLISDVTAPSVPGSTNGFISVSSEPAGSYSYLWSNGSTGASVGGLGPGNYSVTATNAAGCSVARAINLQSCYTFPGSAPNFTDFEIMATGGLFSGLTDQETNLSALIKEEGETFFTENIPEHYSIRWEFPNGILIGNGGNLIVDQATVLANRPNFLEKGWASISLIVSNGCIEKKLNHYFIICGQVEEQFANTVLSGFFFLESAIIHPCSGLSDGSITVEIPNPEGSEISVIRDGIVLPTLDAPDFSVVQEAGLSAGTYNFEIAIGDCVNSFAFQLTSQPTSLSFQTFNSATKKCEYEESCRGIPLGNYEETAFFDHDNATNFPCEIPIFCGEQEVDSERFRKRIVRGFEYKLILRQLLNNPDISPFEQLYIEGLVTESKRIDNCDRIVYCPATMEKVSSILPSIPRDNGVESNGNGCFRVHCIGLLGIRFRFDVCAHDLNVPDDLFLDEFDPGTNTCLPEQANLFELYHAWQELDAFSDVPDFHETELHHILLQFGNTPEAKCATIIYCVNDLDQILYNDVDRVDCTDQTRFIYNVRGDIPWEENIPICEPPIYVSPDPEGNLTYEIVLCNNGGSIKEHVIDYGYFPPGPEGGRPSNIIIDKFDLDTFYIEKLASLGFVKTEGRMVPKPIISTDYDKSVYYDYNHTGKVLSKRKIRNTAFHIDDWDAGQALFCFINEGSKEYEIAYFDSLSSWSHLLHSDNELHISHFSKDEQEITIAGTYSGMLKYDEAIIVEGGAEQTTLFIATIDIEGQFTEMNTITGISSHAGFTASKNIGGRLVIGDRYNADGVVLNDIPVSPPSSDGIFLTTFSTSSGIAEPYIFLSGQEDLQLIRLSQDSSSDNLTAVIKALGGNTIDINGQTNALPEGASYFMLNFFEGALNWIYPISSDGFDETNFDIVHGRNESIFMGITFENSISFADEAVASQGGKDIAIVKIDGLSGAIDWYHTYGSTSNESVTELMYDEYTLFFAGELSGAETYREIGNYNFYNPVPSDSSKVYLSYLFDLDDSTANRPKRSTSVPTGKFMNSEMDFVQIKKVFPNPFSTSFNLILNSLAECSAQIHLFNIFGEPVYTKAFEFVPGENRVNYKVPDNSPDGIYYLQVEVNGVQSNNYKIIRFHK